MNKTQKRKALIEALSILQTEEEYNNFLRDVCTIKEYDDIANRLQMAKLLYDGKTFNEVEKACKASSVTVSRVNRCLKYGRGYRLVLKRLSKKNENKEVDE